MNWSRAQPARTARLCERVCPKVETFKRDTRTGGDLRSGRRFVAKCSLDGAPNWPVACKVGKERFGDRTRASEQQMTKIGRRRRRRKATFGLCQLVAFVRSKTNNKQQCAHCRRRAQRRRRLGRAAACTRKQEECKHFFRTHQRTVCESDRRQAMLC